MEDKLGKEWIEDWYKRNLIEWKKEGKIIKYWSALKQNLNKYDELDEFVEIGLQNKDSAVLCLNLFMSDNDTIPVKYVERFLKDKNLDLSNYYKAPLIERTNDIEYLKKCVSDESLRLNSEEKSNLIIYSNDLNYMRECIINEKLDLDNRDRWNILDETGKLINLDNTAESKLIKERLKSIKDGDRLALSDSERVKLIKEGGMEFVEKCLRTDGFANARDNIIIGIGDIEYLKKCVANQEIKLKDWQKMTLIKYTKDLDYIRECITNENLKLNIDDKMKLLEETRELLDIENKRELKTEDLITLGGTKFVNSYIGDKELASGVDIVKLIKNTKDIDYIRECVINEELNLNKNQKEELIESTRELIDSESDKSIIDLILDGDINFIKKCIGDKNFLNSSERYSLLMEAENYIEPKEYINILKESIKDVDLDIYTCTRAGIISKIGELIETEEYKDYINYIKDCINDKEIKLDSNDKIGLILNIENYEKENYRDYIDYLKECIGNTNLKLEANGKAKIIKEILDHTDNENEKEDIDFITNCMKKDNDIGLRNLDKTDLIYIAQNNKNISIDEKTLDEWKNILKEILESESSVENENYYMVKLQAILDIKKCIKKGDENSLKEYNKLKNDYKEELKSDIQKQNVDEEENLEKMFYLRGIAILDEEENLEEYNELVLNYADEGKFDLGTARKDGLFTNEYVNENLVMFLQKEGLITKETEEEKIKQKTNMYKDILKINENLGTTIDFRMLDDKFMEFGLEKLGRITAYPELQEQIINFSEKENSWPIMKYIMNNSDNWVMEIDQLSRNMEIIQELIENVPGTEIENPIIARNLTNIAMSNENYFDITNMEEVKNFADIKKQKCLDILDGKPRVEMSGKFYNMSKKEQLCFAMLELTYGIDLEQATNIVKKYGKDIDELTGEANAKLEGRKYEELTEDEKDDLRCQTMIKNLKMIIEDDDIESLYQINKDEIRNFSQEEREGINVSAVAMESKCIHMYERMYDKIMYKPQLDEKKDCEIYVDSNGKKHEIDIYEINSDFNMFVRAEGAYNNDWKEPENFLEAVNRPNIECHGNCKSYIGQNSLSLARSNGPTYGYTTCKNNSLLLMAPWDIVSADANEKFSTSNEKWNYMNGIEFRKPDKEIDTTRHGHNEVVSDRIVKNEEGKLEKEKPNYVIWLKESSKQESENDNSRWMKTKKAAAQLGVPIVVIDREKFAQRENEKIEEMRNVFLGVQENKEGLSDEYLLERMVVEFENNRTGMRDAKEIGDKYFTDEQRQDLFDAINTKIEKLKTKDTERYEKCINAMCEVLKEEVGKGKTNTGATFKDIDIKFYEENLLNFEEKRSEIEEAKTNDVEAGNMETKNNRKLLDIYKKYRIQVSDVNEVQKQLKNEIRGKDNQEQIQDEKELV